MCDLCVNNIIDIMTFSIIFDIFGSVPFVIINSILCLIIYQCILKYWNYFSRQNVKFVRGLPILGSQYRSIIGTESIFDGFQRMYDDFPMEQICGIYEIGGSPKYVVRDPELIKQITTKDFDHFLNHYFGVHEDGDPVFGRTLFMMRDQRWKDMRSTLSPAFTGSKMKLMFGLLTEVSKQFCDFILKKDEVIECDLKDFVQRYANDAIASCAFGVNIDSLREQDNEFYKTGTVLTDFGFRSMITMMAYSSMPKLMNILKFPIFNKKNTDYFKKLVLENIRYREENGIIRNDMINILIEVKKGLLKNVDDNVSDHLGNNEKITNPMQWTDDDLVAQTILFFLAGFSTISSTMGFIAHALTINPDVQEKLYQEITEVEGKLGGQEISYDVILKMKYLDMVINETMRLWPVNPVNDRMVTKPYKLTESNGNEIQLNPGDGIWLAVLGVHTDPKYFQNPKKFDPERFRDKDNIIPGTFLPFGSGPRMCIAARFAMMECKSFIFHLISNFKLERSTKTPEPMVMKKRVGTVEPENGFWMKIKPRKLKS